MNQLDTSELVPKNAVERAYMQARYWAPSHAWRKGTAELTAGKIGLATGIYLAMVRTQKLEKQEVHAISTLDCILNYTNQLSLSEKLSIVRIICSILSENVIDETESAVGVLERSKQIQNKLMRIAVTFGAQLNENKFAQIEALSLIKKTTNQDLIEASITKNRIADLSKFIDECKNKLTVLTESSQISNADLPTLSAGAESVLSSIFDRANKLPVDLEVFLLLTKLAKNLISCDLVPEGLCTSKFLRHYGTKLPGSKMSILNGETVAAVLEYELTNQNGLNSFIIDTALKEGKLRSCQDPTAQNRVARSIFEEDYALGLMVLGVKTDQIAGSAQRDERNYQDLSIDLIVAQTLNSLADQLMDKGSFAEAIFCLNHSILARIQANRVEQREIEDLSIIAMWALTTQKYREALTLYSDINKTLKLLTNYKSLWCERLRNCLELLCQLFEQLDEETTNLDVQCFSTINFMTILYARFGEAPQLHNLLSKVLELLNTRVGTKNAVEVFSIYWTDLLRLPFIRKVYEDYVEPLVALTESILDQPIANNYYLDFAAKLRTGNFEKDCALSMLTQIVRGRESSSELYIPTIVPLLVALTTLHLKYKNYRECNEICNRILELDQSELKLLPPGSMLQLQCAHAVQQLEKNLLELKRIEQNSSSTTQTRKSNLANKEEIQPDKSSPPQFCFMLCAFLGALVRERVRPPQALLTAIGHFEGKTLDAALRNMHDRYEDKVFMSLVQKSMQIKINCKNRSEVAPLGQLLTQTVNRRNLAMVLESLKRNPESERTALQISQLEKAINIMLEAVKVVETKFDVEQAVKDAPAIFSGNSIWQTQIEFCQYLMPIGHHQLSFDLLFELTLATPTIFDKMKVVELFRIVDNLIHAELHANFIDLILQILFKAEPANFDKKMIATFDLILVASLQQNKFVKTQQLLNQAKIITAGHDAAGREQDFVMTTAKRISATNAEAAYDILQSLELAVAELKKEEIFCYDLEIFQTTFKDSLKS